MSDLWTINSINQVHQFFSLPSPQHPLVTVVNVYDRMSQFDFENKRFVFDLYVVILKGRLGGCFTYGRKLCDYQKGTIIFIRPGQAAEFENSDDIIDEDAWALIFHPDLIRESELGRKIDDYTFFSYEANEALHVSNDEKRILRQVVESIVREYSQSMDKYSRGLIVSNIKLLLDYCLRYFDRQFYQRTSLNKDVVTGFINLLKQYYNSREHEKMGLPSVAYCSKMLGMSSYYLSDLLKKETGKGAQEHIHSFIIERAKTALLNSNDFVGQIAYELGFQHPPHFSKLFKNKTGLSPSQYRNYKLEK